MLSKEEILVKKIIQFPSTEEMEEEAIRHNVLQAMDEYAKQEAIGFQEWLDELWVKGGSIQRISIRSEPKWFFNRLPNEKAGNQSWMEFATDQLFQEYLKSKSDATK